MNSEPLHNWNAHYFLFTIFYCKVIHLTEKLGIWRYLCTHRKCYIAELTFQENFWIYKMENWNSAGISNGISKKSAFDTTASDWLLSAQDLWLRLPLFLPRLGVKKHALLTDRKSATFRKPGEVKQNYQLCC